MSFQPVLIVFEPKHRRVKGADDIHIRTVLWNGQRVVLDMAIRALDHPVTTRYRPALVLGALREDVWHVPLIGAVLERPSVTHFYRPGLPGGLVPFLTPGPRARADRLFARAVEHYREGRPAAAFVQLGRAAHLLTDMACPVHAQRTVHMISDPFEWYVEGNAGALEHLPVPAVAPRGRASELVEDLARHTQRFAPDLTSSPWGRLLWKAGLRRKLPVPVLSDQARQLIPLAAGHAAALLRLFLRQAAGDAVLVGTVPALETPAP